VRAHQVEGNFVRLHTPKKRHDRALLVAKYSAKHPNQERVTYRALPGLDQAPSDAEVLEWLRLLEQNGDCAGGFFPWEIQ
jgi:hypothetical protein